MKMARPILLTPQAKEDLLTIWLFIARDKPAAATAIIETIEAGWQLLAEQPYSGMARDDISPGLRHQVTRGYISFYRVEERAILILRVLHSRQQNTAPYS